MQLRMTRIGKHGSIIWMLTASSILVGQSDDSPIKFQNHASAEDVRQIVESSVVATQRHWQARLHYSYLGCDESRRLDSVGRVKLEDIDLTRTVLVNGVPFEQLLERNGQPPSAEEDRKQQEKINKLKQETAAQRAERIRIQEQEDTSIVREVSKAFDFQLVGEEPVNGRPAYVLQATPHPGYQAQSKYGKMFPKVKGMLWVDKQDFGWIKADGEVIQSFSIGLFLARVLPGSHISMEQTRVGDGLWMPERVVVRAATKVFFLKSVVIERILTYSDYRLTQACVLAMAKEPQ